jgi:hypothetical protein
LFGLAADEACSQVKAASTCAQQHSIDVQQQVQQNSQRTMFAMLS